MSERLKKLKQRAADIFRGDPTLLRRTLGYAGISSTIIGAGIEFITLVSEVQHPTGEIIALGSGIVLGALVAVKEILPYIPQAFHRGRRTRLIQEEFGGNLRERLIRKEFDEN